jgi:hypothetical protein
VRFRVVRGAVDSRGSLSFQRTTKDIALTLRQCSKCGRVCGRVIAVNRKDVARSSECSPFRPQLNAATRRSLTFNPLKTKRICFI